MSKERFHLEAGLNTIVLKGKLVDSGYGVFRGSVLLVFRSNDNALTSHLATEISGWLKPEEGLLVKALTPIPLGDGVHDLHVFTRRGRIICAMLGSCSKSNRAICFLIELKHCLEWIM